MARPANPATDFSEDVDGIGTFVFGARKLADHIKIGVEHNRLTEGVDATAWLDALCTAVAELKVLTVRAPDGWNIDDMDPLDEETYKKLFKVHAALVAKEGSFRKGPAAAREGAGTAAGGNT